MRTKSAGALFVAAALALLPADISAQSSLVSEGAVVYGQNCTRCHSARSSMERTDREWVTIVMHMRARGNLTKTQARQVLGFLQATNIDAQPTAVARPQPAEDEETEVSPKKKEDKKDPGWLTRLEAYQRSLEKNPKPQ